MSCFSHGLSPCERNQGSWRSHDLSCCLLPAPGQLLLPDQAPQDGDASQQRNVIGTSLSLVCSSRAPLLVSSRSKTSQG